MGRRISGYTKRHELRPLENWKVWSTRAGYDDYSDSVWCAPARLLEARNEMLSLILRSSRKLLLLVTLLTGGGALACAQSVERPPDDTGRAVLDGSAVSPNTGQQPETVPESPTNGEVAPIAEAEGVQEPEDPDAALQRRLESLEQEVRQLRRTTSETNERIEQRQTTLWTGLKEKVGRFPTLHWSGFVQSDTGWIWQDDRSETAVGDIDANAGLRRVRLRVDGQVRRGTDYVVDLDFAASGHPSFRNAGVTFRELPRIDNLQVGYFKTPFGLDGLTSGRELLFMERQLPFALAPFRQILMGGYGTIWDGCGTWSLAGYRTPTNQFGVYESGEGGYALAGRLTWLPLYCDNGNRMIHFGVDYSVGEPGGGVLRYAIEPGFFVDDPTSGSRGSPTILDTGDIETDLFNLFNLEFGMNAGAFHLVSELRCSVVDQTDGPQLTFPGMYVQAGYVLTGEGHTYDRRLGIFRRVEPNCPFEIGRGGGAVEVTAGWAYLDLNDENITGGAAHVYTIGLNWYLTRYTKVMVNVLPIVLDTPGLGTSHANVVGARAQIEF